MSEAERSGPARGGGIADTLSKVPSWLWLGAIGGGAILVILRARSGASSSAVPSQFQPDYSSLPTAQDLAYNQQLVSPGATSTTPPPGSYQLPDGSYGNYQQYWSALHSAPGDQADPNAQNYYIPGANNGAGGYGNYQQWYAQTQLGQAQNGLASSLPSGIVPANPQDLPGTSRNRPPNSGGAGGYYDWMSQAGTARGDGFAAWAADGLGHAGLGGMAAGDPPPTPRAVGVLGAVHRRHIDAILPQMWQDTGTEM